MPIKQEVTGKKETDFLESRTKDIDGATGNGFSRSKSIEDKYKKFGNADEATRDEKNYEKKLDFRCEGKIVHLCW